MQPRITINLTYFKKLEEIKKSLEEGKTVSLEVELHGILFGEAQQKRLLTFHDPSEAQEKIVARVKEQEEALNDCKDFINLLEDKLRRKEEQNERLMDRLNSITNTKSYKICKKLRLT